MKSNSVEEKNKIKFTLENGTEFKVKLPEFVERDCFFALGVRRSGSTLLQKTVKIICNFNQVPVVALTNQAFKQNIAPEQWFKCDDLTQVIQDGAGYIGFRALPDFLPKSDLFHHRKKILLVRDPRDTIVSGYFSIAYSHQVPDANTQNVEGLRENMLRKREITKSQLIDDYALENAAKLHSTLSKYLQILDLPNLKIYRYEDVVMNKSPWIKSMADFLELDLPDKLLNRILKRIDILPEQEQPNEHVRRVIPGDHQNKLKPETIDQLNHTFLDIMKAFNYSID